MRWLLYLLLAVALFGAGFGSGYFWANQARTGESSSTSCLDVSEVRLQRPDFNSPIIPCSVAPCIVGVVHNNCDKRFPSVALVFNLYDAAGVQIGSESATVSNLDARGKARFGAVTLGQKIRQLKLDHIEATPAR